MLENYAVRITYSFEKISAVIRAWSLHCKKIACYQHDDDGANNLHCHLHLEDVDCSFKRLSQLAAECLPITKPSGIPGKRAASLLTHRTKDYDKNIAGYAYLTKGKYDPKYLQGFTTEETEVWKSSWVTPASHTKRTPWVILYEKYKEQAPQKLEFDVDRFFEAKIHNPKLIHPHFVQLEAHARAWVRTQIPAGTWCPQFTAMLTCVVKTHCWNNGISIPNGWKAN